MQEPGKVRQPLPQQFARLRSVIAFPQPRTKKGLCSGRGVDVFGLLEESLQEYLMQWWRVPPFFKRPEAAYSAREYRSARHGARLRGGLGLRLGLGSPGPLPVKRSK